MFCRSTRFAAQTPEGVLPKADWKTRLEALAAIGLSATDLTVHYSEEDFCGYSVRLTTPLPSLRWILNYVLVAV